MCGNLRRPTGLTIARSYRPTGLAIARSYRPTGLAIARSYRPTGLAIARSYRPTGLAIARSYRPTGLATVPQVLQLPEAVDELNSKSNTTPLINPLPPRGKVKHFELCEGVRQEY